MKAFVRYAHDQIVIMNDMMLDTVWSVMYGVFLNAVPRIASIAKIDPKNLANVKWLYNEACPKYPYEADVRGKYTSALEKKV